MLHREMLIDGHFVGGECDQSVGKLVMRSPFDGAVVGTAAEGGWSEANTALQSAFDAYRTWRHSGKAERQALLRRIAALVRERHVELAEILTDEVGKPTKWSEGEVLRLGLTFDLAADTLDSWGTGSHSLGYDPRGDGYTGTVQRFPVGVVLGIVPYNWPYNLAAHKVAPALAVGNTVVLKPSNQAPLSTLTLARLIHEAGCPPGVVNAVVCPAAIAEKMALDPRVAMVSFTGSPPVGWRLKGLLPEKRVALELGGDASAILCEDADFDWAIPRIISAGYGYAGQICISIQHVLVQRSRYEEAVVRLVQATRECPSGDPRESDVVCGPLISRAAADKVMEWIEEATQQGARVLAGGARNGNVVEPTLMDNVPSHVRLGCEEVFGPVMTVAPFDSVEEVISMVNASRYGIQCGVFTHDEAVADRMFDELEVGGVVINDTPTLRFDVMPYGGVKRSGFGREGVRYTMDEMSELKALVKCD